MIRLMSCCSGQRRSSLARAELLQSHQIVGLKRQPIR